MYAIVRSGGTQQKVAVGDVIEIDSLTDAVGDTVALPAVLVVDGDTVTTDAAASSDPHLTGRVATRLFTVCGRGW